MKRRTTLLATLALCASSLAPSAAWAQNDYPSRPLRMILGFAPGGPADIMARLVAQGMGERLGQPVVVENRPGAATSIAALAVAKAPPDGYTLLWGPSTTMVANPALRNDLGYDPIKSFTQLGLIADMVVMLVMNNDVKLTSLQDLITQSKADPRKFFYGTSGAGSAMNFAAEQLKYLTGIQMDHVPFSGSVPNLAALMSGQIQIASDLTVASMPLIKAGRIKPLAVMSLQRLPELPDVPTVAETLPGFAFSTFQALQAPAGLPAPLRGRLEAVLKEVVGTQAFQKRLHELNFIPAYGDGAAAQARIEKELAEYRAIAARVDMRAAQ